METNPLFWSTLFFCLRNGVTDPHLYWLFENEYKMYDKLSFEAQMKFHRGE